MNQIQEVSVCKHCELLPRDRDDCERRVQLTLLAADLASSLSLSLDVLEVGLASEQDQVFLDLNEVGVLAQDLVHVADELVDGGQ